MFRNLIKISGSLSIITVVYLTSAMLAQGQFSGTFGSKMDVLLSRKKPPQVYLMGTTISVRGKSQIATHSNYSAQMASMIESELINNDRRLRPENRSPETIISLEITRLDSGDRWEQRRSKERRKTGEQQVWNDKKQKYETKAIYQDVEVTKSYRIISGDINVSYQVKDITTGAILDSDTFPVNYNREFLDGNGAPLPENVEHWLVQGVVNRIIPRLVPTTETVTVLLAQGKLKDTSKFGEAGLWQKMVEAFEAMPPLKKPKDDSYRLYNIGVGYEALAYKAEDMAAAKKFLEKAAILYGQAYEANPGEKYFKEPQMRIEQAIAQYKKIEDQQSAYARALAVKEQHAAQQRLLQEERATQGSKGTGGGKGVSQPDRNSMANRPLDNQQIINLAGKGLDDANLIDMIKRAPEVKFDLGPQSLSDLLTNKVSNSVIAAMRARQGVKRASGRSATTRKRN